MPLKQVKPEEIKEVIASYTDSGEIKKIQTNGFHIGGEKFMTVRAEDRGVYGRKVGGHDLHQAIPNTLCSTLLHHSLPSMWTSILTRLPFGPVGKGRHHSSQNHTGGPCRTLSRDCPTGQCYDNGGEIGRLPCERRVLITS